MTRVFEAGQRGAGTSTEAPETQEALDSLHIGLSIFDGDLRLVACNRTFLTMLDFPAELGVAGTPPEAFGRLHTLRGQHGPCFKGGDRHEWVRQGLAEGRTFYAGSVRKHQPGRNNTR